MRHSLPTLLLLLASTRAQALALDGLDPVALCAGESRAGDAALALQHGPFQYRFADANNLAAFRSDPARYEIQFGGACARMGPLSGTGDPARWHVHDGRIYVFASDACRDGFRKRPAIFVAVDEPMPAADPAGAALLQRAIAAHGGAERLRAWRSYRCEWRHSDGKTRQAWRLLGVLPDRFRTEHDYHQGDAEWRYANAVTGDGGFLLTAGKTTAMHASAQREFRHQLLREPLLALRRALDVPHAAVARGHGRVGDLAVEQFDLWLDGALLTLGLDAEGRVATLSCRDRGPQLWFGRLERTFSDFEVEAGILVARRVRAVFDGKPAPSLDEDRAPIAIDGPIADDLFQAPK